MEPYVTYLRLAGLALGVVGATLVFVEFFQIPEYVEYRENFGDYKVRLSPDEPGEYTNIGRVGAILIAVSFTLQFFAVLLE